MHTTSHFQLKHLYLMTIIILPGCCLKTLVVCELVVQQYLNFTPILCISELTVTCIKLLLTYSLTYLSLTDELKKISWSGIPAKFRPLTWKMLSVSV